MKFNKRSTPFTEDAENDESNALNQEIKEGEKFINRRHFHCQQSKSEFEGKGTKLKCPNWIYITILSVIITVFTAQTILQIAISSQKRSEFSKNIQMLKKGYPTQEKALQTAADHVALRKQTQTSVNLPLQPALHPQQESNKINLKGNQAAALKQQQPTTKNTPAVQQSQDSQLQENSQKPNPNINYIIPQNKFAPYVPVGATILPTQTPSYNLQLTQSQSLAPQLTKVKQVMLEPEVAVDSNLKNNFDFQSFGQPLPQISSSIIVNPIISPFNDVPTTNNDYTFEGSSAGITISQLGFAKELHKLVESDPESLNKIASEEKAYYEERYSISKYQQLPFCIVVPTFNNAANDRYLKNIKSILMQDYSNFHIVVIDDGSEDNTGILIKDYLDKQERVPSKRYRILRNTVQLRAMPNLRTAAKMHCKPEEIFLIVDGDDELLGRQVLKLFNSVFQEKKLWFVYSNFLSTIGGVGFSRPFPARTIEKNNYRSYPFVTSHLRAFYTKLFVNILEDDLKDSEGRYLKAANDVAICLPILEQSHERVGYLPELTYFYNSNTGLNNHIVRLAEQRNNDQMLRRKDRYKRLPDLFD